MDWLSVAVAFASGFFTRAACDFILRAWDRRDEADNDRKFGD